MEVRCPECTQRLRYADALSNPVLRCGNCGTTFRPKDLPSQHLPSQHLPSQHLPSQHLPSQREAITTAVAIDEQHETEERAFRHDGRDSFPDAIPESTAPSTVPSTAANRGWGTAALVVMLVVFKVGPRLWREFHRDVRPNPPARMRQAERNDIEKIVRESRKKFENQPRIVPRQLVP